MDSISSDSMDALFEDSTLYQPVAPRGLSPVAPPTVLSAPVNTTVANASGNSRSTLHESPYVPLTIRHPYQVPPVVDYPSATSSSIGLKPAEDLLTPLRETLDDPTSK